MGEGEDCNVYRGVDCGEGLMCLPNCEGDILLEKWWTCQKVNDSYEIPDNIIRKVGEKCQTHCHYMCEDTFGVSCEPSCGEEEKCPNDMKCFRRTKFGKLGDPCYTSSASRDALWCGEGPTM
eukprot:TRINITY_DN36174_c0_g1_i1.p1 TRINITY_DN36174_c0_g1~~TRINITY_DN36174_c0_g1_i1.p1  ORF type:complete len:122 (-),score=15.58 TRINITY_DN36174_c0_g1_i1:10-375(-)